MVEPCLITGPTLDEDERKELQATLGLLMRSVGEISREDMAEILFEGIEVIIATTWDVARRDICPGLSHD